MSGPWRDPDEESADLYPNLVVHDGRVAGSITVGRSRLSLWAFVGTAIRDGWDGVERGWEPGRYGFTADDMADFLHYLLEARGEFGRLLLVLAAAERSERAGQSWWKGKKHRKRVQRQLWRCLVALEDA